MKYETTLITDLKGLLKFAPKWQGDPLELMVNNLNVLLVQLSGRTPTISPTSIRRFFSVGGTLGLVIKGKTIAAAV